MTIARIGPSKFEHQYRVTAWLAIRSFADAPRVLVEPDGEEDISISFADTGQHIEVQVKGSEADVGLTQLVDWLLHFPERSPVGCLLERLFQPNRSVVFVAGGRCNDSISDRVVDMTSGAPWRNINRVQSPLVQAFLAALDHAVRGMSTDTPLAVQRAKHAQSLSARLTTKQASDLLGTIGIVEGVTSRTLELLIPTLMARDLQVPMNGAWELFDGPVRREVEQARDSRGDAFPGIARIVRSSAAGQIRPSVGYLPRRDLDATVRSLFGKIGVLLLSGMPFSGKTDLARSIAAEAQGKGEHAREFSELEEAVRWLRSPAGENRLAVLHDPFGSHELEAGATNKIQVLRDFVSVLPAGRRLIVTSRSDVLIQLPGGAPAFRSGGQDVEWTDVTLRNSELAVDLWCSLGIGRSAEQLAHVSGLIAQCSEEQLLQPGHLARLATYPDLGRASFDELRAIADEPARALGASLAVEQSCTELLAALRLTASTIVSVSEATLCYVVNGQDRGQGVRTDGIRVIGGGDEEEVRFPEIEGLFTFSREQLRAIELLERRGLVRADIGGERFAHPMYEIAADAAVAAAGPRRAKELGGMILRAICGLDDRAAQHAVRALTRRAGTHGRIEADVVAQLLAGCSSVFPAVADSSLRVLLEAYQGLSTDEQLDVLKAAADLRALAGTIIWRDSVAWFDPRAMRPWPLWFDPALEARVEGLAKRLLATDDATFSDEEIWLLLEEPRVAALSGQQRERLFRFGQASEVALVRARVATEVARHIASLPDSTWRHSISDPHPLIVAAVVQGLLESWATLGPDLQAELDGLLLWRIGPAQAVGILQDVLLTYEYAEVPANDGLASWDLWLRLATLGLKHVPIRAVHSPRLDLFAKYAIPHSSAAVITPFLEAWCDWLIRGTRDGMPDDYALGVIDLVPAELHALRAQLATRLFSQEDTLIRGATCRELINDWDELDEHTRGLVIAELNTNRVDCRWVAAIAIARYNVPPAIQECLLPSGCSLNSSPAEFVANCPPRLLCDALAVYCGHPQPLWWLGTHHANSKFWSSIIVFLVSLPSHPCFGIAVREAIGEDEDYFRDAVATACRDMGADDVWRVTEALLRDSIGTSHNRAGPLWESVLKQVQTWGLMGRLAEAVLPNLEALDDFGNLDVLLRDAVIGRTLTNALPSDIAAMRLVAAFRDLSSSTRERVLDLIGELYRSQPPRLVRTHDAVLGLQWDGFHDVREIVKNCRLEALHRASEQRDLWRDEFAIEDWLSLGPP